MAVVVSTWINPFRDYRKCKRGRGLASPKLSLYRTSTKKKPFFISLYRKLTLAVTLDFVRSIKEPSLEAPSGQLKKLLKDLSSLKDAFKEFVDELKIPYSSSNSGQKALPIWFPHCPTKIKYQMFKFIRSIKIY